MTCVKKHVEVERALVQHLGDLDSRGLLCSFDVGFISLDLNFLCKKIKVLN